MVGSPTRRSGRGQGQPEGSGGVGLPTLKSGKGRESLPEVREGSGGPPGDQVRVGKTTRRFGIGPGLTRRSGSGRGPTQRSGRGLESHPEVK